MKILIIRFGSLGDLVLTFPALRDLAASVDSEIHYLLLEEYAQLLSPLSCIQRVWTLPRGAGTRELRELARRLEAERFDLVLDLHRNLRSRLLKRWLKSSVGNWECTRRQDLRRRLMVSRRFWPDAWRTRRALIPVRRRHRETVRRALDSRYRAGEEEIFEPGEAAREAVAAELKELGLDPAARPLAVAPGSAWPEKIWPHFPALMKELSAESPVLVFGGPGEEKTCRDLARANRALAYCGAKPLPKVAAALLRCRLLIGGDTGLGHLAEAAGVPVLSIFGPTVPAFGFGPSGASSRVLERDLGCRPCSLHGEKPCRYGHRDCLAGISVDRLLEILAEMDEASG